jgi:hypothetical protein
MDSMLASKIVVIILTYRQPAKTLECLSYLTAEPDVALSDSGMGQWLAR